MHRTTVIAIFFAFIMLLWPIAGAVGATGVGSGSSVSSDVNDTVDPNDVSTDSVEYGELISVNESVNVWDRAVYPLRVDRTQDGVATSVDNLDIKGSQSGMGVKSLDINQLVVYEDLDSLELDFDSSRALAGDQFEGEDVDLISVRGTTVDAPEVPTTLDIDELREFLADQAESEEFVFDIPDTGELDDDGEGEFAVDNPEAGVYSFVLVRTADGDGASVTDGNLSIDGEIDILGADSAVVQETSSEVTVDSTHETGDTIEFDVDANLDTQDDRVEHAVALWNESDVSDQDITIVAPDNVDSDTSMEDFTIEHSIERVAGVATMEDGVSAFGTDLSDRRSAGIFELQDLLTSLANDFEFDGPDLEPGDEIVNGSATSVNVTDSDTTIEVETLDDFEPGEYVAVHTAIADGDLTKTSSNRVDITLVEELDDPFFDVTIDETNSPVTEGETLEVDATIENTGEQEDTQDIELLDFDDDDVDSEEVTLGGGEDTTITLEWETDEGDADTGDVTVTSDDDSDTEEVTIDEEPDPEPPDPDPADFQVDIVETNSPIDEGETLVVTADIENVGEEDDTQRIDLLIDGEEVDSTFESIDAGDSDTVELEWETEANDAGDYEAEVSSDDDSDTADVTVEAVDDAFFDVTIEDTNAPITEGEELDVDVLVENTGGQEDTQTIVLEDFDGTQVDDQEATLEPDEDVSFTLTWDTEVTDAGTDDITVTSDDDTDTEEVTIEPDIDPAFFTVDITDVPDEVTEGEEIDVAYTVENEGEATDTQNIVFEVDDEEIAVEEDVELEENETFDGTFVYETDSDDVPSVTVSVASDDDDDSADVTVEEVAEPFFAVELDLDADELVAGEDLTGDVTVENTGTAADEQVVEVTFGDELILEEDTGELEPGAEASFTIDHPTDLDDVGDQEVTASTANDSDTELVTILQPATYEVDIVEGDSRLDVVAGQTIDVVIEVQNVGDVAGEETIELVDERDESVLDDISVDLEPGDDEDVELSFETDADDVEDSPFEVTAESPDDTDTVTVTVEDVEAYLDVEIVDLDPETVDEPVPGEESTVSVEIDATNLGTESLEQDVTFLVDGEERVDPETVELDGGESETLDVDLPIEYGDAPAVDITVESEDDADTETLEVTGVAAFDITILDATGAVEQPVEVNETFTPEIELENVGGQDGNATVDVWFAGDRILEAFDVSDLEPGDTVRVDEEAGDAIDITPDEDLEDSVRVLEAEATNDQTDETDDRSTRRVRIGELPDFQIEEFDVVDADGEPTDEFEEGEQLGAEVTIENRGGSADTQTIVFSVDDNERATETITLEPDESETLTVEEFAYETRSGDIGTLPVAVETDDDEAAAEVEVLEQAVFVIPSLEVDDGVIAEEPFDASVTVENVGGVTGSETVRLFADGVRIGTESVDDLEAGASEIVEFTDLTVADTTGTEILAVTSDDAQADTIAVGEPGEITLDIRSVTDPVLADEEFAITVRAENVGDGFIEEDLTLEIEDADGEFQEADVATVALEGNERDRVTLTDADVIDRAIDDEEEVEARVTGETDAVTTTFTLREPPEEAFFRVSNLDAPDQVLDVEDRTIEITADIDNLGEVDETQDIVLEIDGEEFESEFTSVDGGESEGVEFTVETSEIGVGEGIPIEILSDDDSATTTITIEEPEPGTPAIIDADSEETATQDEPFDVTVTVQNVGDLELASGESSIVFDYLADDTVSETADPVEEAEGDTMDPGDEVEMTLSVTPPAEPLAGEFLREFELRAERDDAITDSALAPIAVDFEDIQSGVDVAEPGDTVSVAPGEYRQRNRITVDTPDITITTANPIATPVVEDPRRDDVGFEITADGVTIDGLAVVGDGSGTGIVIDADETSIEDTRIAEWESGIEEVGGSSTIVGTVIVDIADTGLLLDGDGDSEIAFSRIARADDVGLDVRSDDNLLRVVRILNSETALVVTGDDNVLLGSAIRGNELGLQPALGDDRSFEIRDGNVLEGNDLNALILLDDQATVVSQGNWWGTPDPQAGSEFTVRSEFEPDPLEERPEGPEFVVDLDAPEEAILDEEFTVEATIDNEGDQSDRQTIELLVDGSVVDSEAVELDPDEDEAVTLAHTPDLTDGEDGDDITVRVRSDDVDDSAEVTLTEEVEPAFFDIVDITANESVAVGEEIEVSADIENIGDEEDTQLIQLVSTTAFAAYTDEDGIVQTEGHRTAIEDWREGAIGTETLREIIEAWRSNEPVDDGGVVDEEELTLAGGVTETVTLTYIATEENVPEIELRVQTIDDNETVTVAVERAAATYADEDGTVGTDGLRDAIADWREGDIETDLLRDVIDAWRSGEPVT